MTLATWLYQHPVYLVTGLVVITLWELVWKGIGMWYASRNKQKNWFIVLLVLNTMGLLPIAYLLWFKPKRKDFVIGEKPEKKSKK